jgi:hypothetical protein
MNDLKIDRRMMLAAGATAVAAGATGAVEGDKALIAITLDLEMSRNFPEWEATHWDYEKGNLNAETKAYAVEAARRVKARGGRIHFFCLGQTLEQENVDWLKQLAAEGHSIGNHTYDHVNIRATKPVELQFRFQRSPWLIEGREPAQLIRDNIRLTTAAMKSRLGIEPAGFPNGLADRPDLQKMLLDLGFTWVSSKYAGHKITPAAAPDGAPPRRKGEVPGEPPREIIDSIVAAQAESQPFRYDSGLIEVPMSPISDIGAFRTGRWPLRWFLAAIQAAIDHVIARRTVFDLLLHPSCLYVTDPDFKTIDSVLDLVEKVGPRTMLSDLTAFARRFSST